MPSNDDPVTANPPSAPVATPLAGILVPAAVALAAGGVILAVAVAWGAAEAAVGVGAAYLVYSAVTGGGDLSGSLATRLLTGVFRRPGVAGPAER